MKAPTPGGLMAMTHPASSTDVCLPRGVPVFLARGVTKVYGLGEVEVHALRGVDLDLFEGEFVVLLGPSGSGKSTLLNILGGLDVPTEGHVVFENRDLSELGDDALTQYRRR